MGDVALAGGATMEAGGPFPGAEDFAVGSVTVTPVEADVASVVVDVPSMVVDVPSMAVDVPSVAVDVPSVAVDVPSVAVDVPSVAVDVASVAVDVASVAVDMPTVEADMATVEAEAEAVPMVVGAGRFRHNSKLSRPTAFAVGRLVEGYRLWLLGRFWGCKAPFFWGVRRRYSRTWGVRRFWFSLSLPPPSG